LAKNPKVLLIIGICLLIVIAIQSCVAMSMTLFSGLGGGIIGATSYLAEDEDINEAPLRYSEWEIDLLLEAQNAENTHGGYNEYRYNLETPGHDPFAMLAYLTAKHNNFTFIAVQAELKEIFNEQYTLIFDSSMEIRYRTEAYTDCWVDSKGEVHCYTYTVQVPYEWHILTVTLTAQNFVEVITPRLTTQDEQERYELLMKIKGNRQYIGNPFDFYWLPHVSSKYGYRIHPINGGKDYHTGVDIALPEGVPILAGGTGVVLQSGNNGGYGLTILIDYGNGISARYAHCSVLYFSMGQTVESGDVIALVGNTGASTGAHLHMEVIKNGQYLNPYFFVAGTIDF
jgi:murein DD-endopeptidase MepM/ murein hydrolase activator NlpD